MRLSIDVGDPADIRENVEVHHFRLLNVLESVRSAAWQFGGDANAAFRDAFMALPDESLDPVGYSKNEASVDNAWRMCDALFRHSMDTDLLHRMRNTDYESFPDEFGFLSPSEEFRLPGRNAKLTELSAEIMDLRGGASPTP